MISQQAWISQTCTSTHHILSSPDRTDHVSLRNLEDYGDMVTLKVSPTKQIFVFHKKLLCHISAHFDAAFNGGFRESNGVMELEHEDVETFQIFFRWIHGAPFFDSEYTVDNFNPRSRLIYQLYILGNARQIPSLCNAAVDALIDGVVKTNGIPVHGAAAELVYNNTPESSKLRKLMVDFCVKHGMDFNRVKDDDFSLAEYTGHEFLLDLIVALGPYQKMNPQEPIDWTQVDRSQYYEPLDQGGRRSKNAA